MDTIPFPNLPTNLVPRLLSHTCQTTMAGGLRDEKEVKKVVIVGGGLVGVILLIWDVSFFHMCPSRMPFQECPVSETTWSNE